MKIILLSIVLSFLLSSCIRPKPKGNAEGYGMKKTEEKKKSE